MAETNDDSTMLELATELTIAWLANANTRVAAEDVPVFLQTMHDKVTTLSISGSSSTDTPTTEDYQPAVSVRKSLASKDHIISLIDGKPYKTLKRHLSGHGLTPAEYRARYNLKADYPMVAETYAEMRRGLAKKIGLGNKPRGAAKAGASESTAPKAPRAAKPTAAKAKPARRSAKPAAPEVTPQS